VRTGLGKLSAIIALSLSTLAFGEGTRLWEQSKFEDLSKGTAKGVALRSTGGLELAPVFKMLYTTPSTYLWAIAADDGGNVYAAAGAPARVYRVTPSGQASIIFEPQELQVQVLVVDKNGVLYAATAPDGKVYQLPDQQFANLYWFRADWFARKDLQARFRARYSLWQPGGNMKHTRRYLCAACNEPVVKTGEGLGTWRCRKHPARTVTVIRDTSGGHENAKSVRATPVSVGRHTQVRVV